MAQLHKMTCAAGRASWSCPSFAVISSEGLDAGVKWYGDDGG